MMHLARGFCARCYAKQPHIKAQGYAHAKTPKGKATRAKWATSPAGRAARQKRRIVNQYGITLDDYRLMLNEQGGGCAMCGYTPPEPQRLAVDHCHATGKIRGLLCIACNLVLGNAKDDPKRLRAALAYLEEHHHDEPLRSVQLFDDGAAA